MISKDCGEKLVTEGLALERPKDRGHRCRARGSRARGWGIGRLLAFQGGELGFEVQNSLLARWIRGAGSQDCMI